MPVHRFRSVADMEELAWLPPGSPELARAIRRVWALARELAPWRAPPGVHRFRSIEEANACREEWDRQSMPLRRAREMPPGP